MVQMKGLLWDLLRRQSETTPLWLSEPMRQMGQAVRAFQDQSKPCL